MAGARPVANSSISVDVKAANSKLAQMLRKREEDESLLQIGKRKVKDVARREGKSGGGGRAKQARWTAEADFSWASPLVDRPRTSTGSTSFHFSCITISKEGGPTLNGKPMSGSGSGVKSPGVDHSKYIEREGAAERSLGAGHAVYIERPEAVENFDRTGEIEEGMERTLSSIVNELPMEKEAEMLGVEDVRNGMPSIFSNISDDAFEREEYWRAVHRTEREPKTHSILLDPESSPRWWVEMETAPEMDEGFRAHALLIREKHMQWRAAEKVEPTGKPFVAEPWMSSANGIGRALDGARRVAGWNDLDTPLEFKSGRGGRVQFRFVAELPHEITPEDRALLVQNFVHHLATFSRDEAGRPAGMMYTAVIHAPDAHNDRRNYHLHVIAHDRPAKWMPEHGAWDFEVVEEFNHKGQIRQRYPHRQNKIGEVSQGTSKTGRANSGRDFIPGMRNEFARLTNVILNARGIERQLDPRRYEEMGIERTPTEHLGTNAAALESIGVPTIIGKLNAIAIWNDAEKAIEKRARAIDAALKGEQAALRELAADAQVGAPGSSALRSLRSLIAERETLTSDVAEDRRLLMTFDHMEAKAKSRAVRTRQTCLQYLTDIDTGKADKTTRLLNSVIRERWREAQDHIDKIDRELAPDRPKLVAAADDVVAREDRIKEIDSLLVPIKAALENAVQQARAERLEKERRDRNRRDANKPNATAAEAVRAPVQPVATPRPVPVAQPVTPREKTNAIRPEDLAGLARVGRLAIAAFQSDLGPDAAGQAPRSLAGVRNLSGLGMVRDGQGSQVSLQRLSAPVVGRDGVAAGAGDGVRRPGDGDRPVDGEGREGSGLTRGTGRRDAIDEDGTPAAGDGVPPKLPPALDTPSVEGLPIVNPTLDPRSTPIAAEAGTTSTDLPEGMVAVTQPTPRPAASQEDAVVVDIGPVDAVAPVVEGAVSNPKDTRSTTSEAGVSDRPKDAPKAPKGEPKLFPVEESRAPIKPGTQKAEYEEWDALVNSVSRDRIAVIKSNDDRGRVQYDVPSLSDVEQRILKGDRFAARTGGRLAAIHSTQQREVDRLVRWVEKNGREPATLIIEGRSAKLGAEAPESVRKLMRDWRVHPRVTVAIRAENDRRNEAAKASIRAEARRRQEPVATPEQRDEAKVRADRLAHLAETLPEISDAATPQVARLLTLLRQDAPRTAVQEAADAVRNDPIAREDVHRHRVELSLAYNSAIEDDDARSLRDRDRRGGR